jgi:hypothetical protein
MQRYNETTTATTCISTNAYVNIELSFYSLLNRSLMPPMEPMRFVASYGR